MHVLSFSLCPCSILVRPPTELLTVATISLLKVLTSFEKNVAIFLEIW